ncbi:hypothetical protein ACFIOY_22145 [Bradyrhizobium sp. TZ2]
MSDSVKKALTTIDVIEQNRKYLNQKPFCEPKLGDYGLYDSIEDTRPATSRWPFCGC